MPSPPSSRTTYLFVNSKGSVDLNKNSDKETLEARRHVQRFRLPRHARTRKASMLRDCHIQVQVAGRFFNSTLQPPGGHKESLQSENETQISLKTILGQARKDPFIALPVKNVPPVVREIIDHGIHCFWPGLTPIPGNTDSASSPVNQANLQAIYSSPPAYYAYTMAVLGNYKSLVGAQAITKPHVELLLSHRVATLQLINHEINHLKGPPSDELIGAILVMAAADPDDFVDQSRAQKSRFQSPLAKAQFLHVLGAQPDVSAHTMALVRLVKLKGAWKDFRTFKLAEICELLDLMSSSRAGSKPVFPAIDRSQSAIFSRDRSMDDAAKAFSSKLAKALINMPFHEAQPAMLNVVMSMKHLTIALDYFHRGGRNLPDFADIIQARNGTQHVLLSLSEYPDNMSWAEAYLYRTCRLCLLIYSNMVIFPLPPSSGVETRLAVSLKTLLADDDEEYRSATETTAPRMILWALVLGGISDTSDTHRLWFLNQYDQLSSKLGIVTWQQLETCLTSFLWRDSMLNKEAVGFWTASRTRRAPDIYKALPGDRAVVTSS